MSAQRFVEDAELSGVRITKDGYLVASVRAARTGIQVYSGAELGVKDSDTVRVYRPEDEVFSRDSMMTYAHRPITNNHPDVLVDAESWKDHSVGQVGDEVTRDGDYIRVPIMLMDAAAIKDVKGGKTQLSMGYTMDLSFEQGTTPQGESYDAVMRDLKMNHLAIVHKGRAGSEVRIGDSWGAHPITTNDEKHHMSLKTIVVDGLPVETTDAGIAAIEKLQQESKALKVVADSAKAAHDAELQCQAAAHDSVVAEKDKELAVKDAEIASLQGKILSDADLDARVAVRAALITKASSLVKDADFAGKSDLDIKTMAVSAARSPEFVADKSEAYIDAAFDMLEVPVKDPVRDALVSRDVAVVADDDNGYSAYVDSLNNAWKSTGEAA